MAQTLVLDQASTVCKASAAFGTTERSGPRMCSPMLGQVLALRETATTVPTCVRALSCVDALVLDQVGTPAEALAAVTADVRLLTGVGAPVLHQVRVLREALAAVSASAGTLASVRALMP